MIWFRDLSPSYHYNLLTTPLLYPSGSSEGYYIHFYVDPTERPSVSYLKNKHEYLIFPKAEALARSNRSVGRPVKKGKGKKKDRLPSYEGVTFRAINRKFTARLVYGRTEQMRRFYESNSETRARFVSSDLQRIFHGPRSSAFFINIKSSRSTALISCPWNRTLETSRMFLRTSRWMF